MVLGASWVGWALLGRATRVSPCDGAAGPGLAGARRPAGTGHQSAARTSLLRRACPPELFWLLSVELQSPQHMLPHLWRMPQWLAFGCYPILALLALGRPGRGQVKRRSSDLAGRPDPAGHRDLRSTWRVLSGWPGWYRRGAQESLRDSLPTLPDGDGVPGARPDRHLGRVVGSGGMVGSSTVPAHLLVAVGLAGRLDARGRHGRRPDCRAIAEYAETWLPISVCRGSRAVVTYFGVIAYGLNFLAHHDTESGHVPLAGRPRRGVARRQRRRGGEWSPGTFSSR